MFEIVYECSDCKIQIAQWVPGGTEIEQPDECAFCGSEAVHVYINSLANESSPYFTMLHSLLGAVKDVLDKREDTTSDE